MWTNRSCALVAVALATCAAPALRADVTIRYQETVKTAAPLPGQAAPTPPLDSSSTVQMKGHHGVMIDDDSTTLVDFDRQELTLIDPVHRKYATIPGSQYTARMAGSMPQLDSGPGGPMTSKVESRRTGRTEVIQGIPAEEREVTLTVQIATPEGATLPPTSLKMVVQLWTAQQDAVLRNPAIRELTAFQQWQNYFLSPVEMIQKVAPSDAGGNALLEELTKRQSLVLRMDMRIYPPSMAALTGLPADSDAAVMSMHSEVVEISTAPIPDSVFQIPAGFTATTFDEVMNGREPQATRAANASAPEPTPLPSTGSAPLDRFYALADLAHDAWKAGAVDQTAAYAEELLRAAPRYSDDWNYGNAIHVGHMFLGLVAAKRGDLAQARQQLLDAGHTPGSPQLDSFGPNMALALELLRHGDRDTVLEYFALCRAFWKLGGQRLDQWSEIVRNGGTPVFSTNLR